MKIVHSQTNASYETEKADDILGKNREMSTGLNLTKTNMSSLTKLRSLVDGYIKDLWKDDTCCV